LAESARKLIVTPPAVTQRLRALEARVAMADLGATYRDARERLTALLRAQAPEQLTRRVPACPAWNVQDTLAHHLGVLADAVTGDFTAMINATQPSAGNEAARDEATQRQVDERTGRSLDEVIAEWEELCTVIEPQLSEGHMPAGAPPFAEVGATMDLTSHLHDIRGALGEPGDRDAPGNRLTLAGYVGWLGMRHASAGLPPLRIRAEDKDWVFGDGEPQATVTGSRFEIMRAASGRRTKEQVRALVWSADPEPWLELFNPYGSWPEEPLDE
jgi:uncharacterized protein (TIGR03083 family)